MPQACVIVMDPDDERPVYGQIASQLRSRIAAGDLAAGSVLPSVRTIAGDLGVNLNTVARAYRLLEDEGFVRIVQRTGVQVIEPSRETHDADRMERLRDELGTTLARMRQSGARRQDVHRWIDRELAALGWGR